MMAIKMEGIVIIQEIIIKIVTKKVYVHKVVYVAQEAQKMNVLAVYHLDIFHMMDRVCVRKTIQNNFQHLKIVLFHLI